MGLTIWAQIGSILLGVALMADAILSSRRRHGTTHRERQYLRWAEFLVGGILFFVVPAVLENLGVIELLLPGAVPG